MLSINVSVNTTIPKSKAETAKIPMNLYPEFKKRDRQQTFGW